MVNIILPENYRVFTAGGTTSENADNDIFRLSLSRSDGASSFTLICNRKSSENRITLSDESHFDLVQIDNDTWVAVKK